jgi:hypothetical protein
MVKSLPSPKRRLSGGRGWIWYPPSRFPGREMMHQGWWYRVFHCDASNPQPYTRRAYGPVCRFDHHSIDYSDGGPPNPPRACPQDRNIIYLARTLETALVEVFGAIPTAAICPSYRAAAMYVDADCRVQDLTDEGCQEIGALPSLCTGDVPRDLTQEWARAIYEDQPAGVPVAGVLYRSAYDYGLCLALFERSPTLVETVEPGMPMGGFPLQDLSDRVLATLTQRKIEYSPIDPKDCKKCLQAEQSLDIG